MIIVNKTHWRTDNLRAIVRHAAQLELEPAQRCGVRCTVVYAHRGSVSGCAWRGGKWCTLRIGSTHLKETQTADYWIKRLHEAIHPDAKWCTPEHVAYCAQQAVHYTEHPSTDITGFRRRFAALACHELAHIRGMGHRRMPLWFHRDLFKSENLERHFAWADRYPLERS